MTETTFAPHDARLAPGTAADRTPPPLKTATVAGYSASAGMGLAWLDWLISCGFPAHWSYHQPDRALIEMSFMAILPIGHKVWRIFNNWLDKHAGADT